MSNLTPTLNLASGQPRPSPPELANASDASPSAAAARAFDAAPVVAQFMTLWQQGPPVDLQLYLAEVMPLAAADLLAIVLFDQRQRWQHGERRRAEDYLHLCPVLQQNGGAFELILAEWLLRVQSPESPTLAEFQQRFPRYAAALIHQLERKQLLSDDNARAGPMPSTPQPQRPTPTALPNLRIPGYEILGELGRGGMGVVYKALQTSLQRPVALKMILSGYCASAEDIARLRSEAQAVARLRHPNIVQVYEIGEQAGLPFYSLELVEGCTLADRLQGQAQSATDSAALVEALAWAVQHAHQRGVIHRDLKPANVLLSGSREQPLTKAVPKITDFGIARRLDDLSHPTRPGVIVGTPSYMSPEQASGDPHAVGPAADVYALGAILYELLSGGPPFEATTSADTLLQVLNIDPVAPRCHQPKVPRDLETICLKCLQKEPQQRYASAAHLAEDLARFQHQEPILARPVTRVERLAKWARRRPAVASLTLALLVLGLLGFGAMAALWQNAEGAALAAKAARNDAEQNAQAKIVERLKVEKLLTESLLNQGLALCQKGEVSWGLLVLARCLEISTRQERETGQPSPLGSVLRRNLALWEQQLMCELHSFPHGDWVWVVAYSPDGRTLATAGKDRKVQLYSVRTGKPLGAPLEHPHPIWALAFSPDGNYLLTGCGATPQEKGSAHLWRLTPGMAPRQVGKPLEHEGMVMRVAFRPDSKRFLTSGTHGTVNLWIPPANNATEAQLIRQFRCPQGVLSVAVFSPDQRYLLLGASNGVAQLHDADNGAVVGRPLPHNLPIQAAAFRPDGAQFATACGPAQMMGPSQVHLWDTATGELQASTPPREGWVRVVAFHPNGRSFATATTVFDATDNRIPARGEVLLWQADAKGRPGLCQLMTTPLPHPRALRSLAFSPDGRLLATGAEDGLVRLFQAAGGLPMGRPQLAEGAVCSVEFSPDSRTLAMGSAGGDQQAYARLLQVPAGLALVAGHLPEDGPGFPFFHAVHWSPDSRLVAANVMRDGKPGDTFFWEAATGRPHKVFPEGDRRHCSFTNADLSLLVVEDPQGPRRFYRRDTLQPLGELPATENRAQIVISPSGRLAVAVHGEPNLLRLFRTATGAKVGGDLKKPALLTRCVTFTADERYLLVSAISSYAQDQRGSFLLVIDTSTGRQIHKREIVAEMSTLVCSPDGQLLATGETNNRVQVWQGHSEPAHLRTQTLGSGLLHQGRVNGVAFNRDGGLLASASADETAQLWDIPTGVALGPSLRHSFRVTAVAIAPDGNRLATAQEQGPLVVWQIPPPMCGSPAQIMRRIEELTGLRLDEHNQPQSLALTK